MNDKIILDTNALENQSNIRSIVTDLLSTGQSNDNTSELPFDMMNEEDADEARKFFGVF
jgi:hypothetical protein